MDRSFLSNVDVIAASREFVCVRLMSYEDPAEMAFLKSFGAGKSGEAENTVFCMLAPDGKRQLTRATRGPRSLYSDADEMAKRMRTIAKDYADSPEPATRVLPTITNFRLALNVAACDRQPLVVLVSKPGQDKAEAALAKLSFSPDFLGRFVYVSVADPKELKMIEGFDANATLLVMQPDAFGLKGKLLSQATETTSARMSQALKEGLASSQLQPREFWSHVKTGQSQGVFWQTQTPVTDPMELRAREKGRKSKSPSE
jgi:hypothetical protein